MIDESRIAQYIYPAHGSDDETDPEREHNEKQEDRFLSSGASIEEICRNIAHDQAQSDSLKRNTDGSYKDGRIEEVSEKLGIITELKSRDVSPRRRSQPETVNYDKTHRNN